jgi:hypothetical protein
MDPSDVGGYPQLNSAPAPNDSDNDGMPDTWEIDNGLDPQNASDRNNIGAGGYTMIEVYLNSLVGTPEPPEGLCGDVDNSGIVNIVDALLTAQFYVNMNPQPFNQSVADVNGDGNISILDALKIAQYYVKIISSFEGC